MAQPQYEAAVHAAMREAGLHPGIPWQPRLMPAPKRKRAPWDFFNPTLPKRRREVTYIHRSPFTQDILDGGPTLHGYQRLGNEVLRTPVTGATAKHGLPRWATSVGHEVLDAAGS